MKMRLPLLALALSFAVGVFAPTAVTQAIAHDGPGVHERSGHLDHRDLPTCNASNVLSRVIDRAASSYTPAYPAIHISAIDSIRQTRHLGMVNAGLRERRWCQGRAHLADGRTRTVFYLVEARGAFAGITFGVESCMSGHDADRWNVYGAHCSTVRAW